MHCMPRTAALLLCLACAGWAQSPEAISRELKEICDADQSDRTGPGFAPGADERDHQRRARVLEILKTAELTTADDFFNAALVLQHGEVPEDFLLAHVLATAAGIRGHKTGAWLAAATLDRYLQRIGKPQVFGTQYVKSGDASDWTQGEYSRDLLSDALRKAFGVPGLAKQVESMQKMNKK
jgi:hypothetical protein